MSNEAQTRSDQARAVVPAFLKWAADGSPESVDEATRSRQWAEARRYIASSPVCNLATISKDGRPQQTVVWVGLDGDDLVIPHLLEYVKVRNIRRDARVSVSLSTGSRTEMGAFEYLVIEGTATVTPGGAPELLRRLAKAYLGPDVKYPPQDDPPEGFITRVTPRRLRGWGPWQEALPSTAMR